MECKDYPAKNHVIHLDKSLKKKFLSGNIKFVLGMYSPEINTSLREWSQGTLLFKDFGFLDSSYLVTYLSFNLITGKSLALSDEYSAEEFGFPHMQDLVEYTKNEFNMDFEEFKSAKFIVYKPRLDVSVNVANMPEFSEVPARA